MKTPTCSPLPRRSTLRDLKGITWEFAIVLGLLLAGSLTAPAQTTLVVSNAWTIPADTYSFIPSSGNDPRGVAINRVTGNVLVPSPGGANTVQVLSSVDGSYLGPMNSVAAIQGGNSKFIIHVAAADDGVIYACNLDTARNFRIYRWDAEDISGTISPTLAFAGVTATNVADNRCGDAFCVRGAGTNTQIIASGTSSSFFSVFTTADGTNFTATSIRLPAPLDPGGARRGVAFDGTNDAFYGIAPNSATFYRVGFNLVTSNATVLATNTLSIPVSLISVRKIGDTKVLAGIRDNGGAPGEHRLLVYDITDEPVISPVVGGDVFFPAPAVQDANITGGSDISTNLIVGFNTHNGLVALSNVFLPPIAPAVVVNPLDATVIETWTAAFSGDASGTKPGYQWYFDGNSIANATNKNLSIPNVQLANAGEYYFLVANSVGTANSTTGILSVLSANFTPVAAPVWRITNGTRPFLQNDNNCRGLAYHSLSNRVLVASRTGSNVIWVLNADTGATVTNLNMTGVGGQPGETFPLNLVATTPDGKVYACNLGSVADGSGFTIYRWADANPATAPTIVYGPSSPLSERIGDSFIAIHGPSPGASPILIAASATNDTVAVFEETLPGSFTASSVVISGAVPGFARLGLAPWPPFVFVGSDVTARFWAKTPGAYLREVRLSNAAAVWSGGVFSTNLASLNTLSVIGFDEGNLLIGGVALQTPDNFQLFDVFGTADSVADSPLMDREFFPTDNANGNGTGAVAFDVAGGRVFALDSNNGLSALKYAPPLRKTVSGASLTMSWAGPAKLQSSTNVAGVCVDVPGATSPRTYNGPSDQFFRLRN